MTLADNLLNQYEWLRYLSSDSKNTVIGLVRNTVSTKTKLADENIKTVHVLEADMADHISLNKAAGELSKITDGALDYLIINGAYNNPETAFLAPSAFQGKEDVIRKDLITSLEVNVLGTIYSINAFLPLIRKGLAKKIVVISTGLADMDATLLTGNPCFVAYSSMKAALNMIVVKYSNELRGEDIQLLALSPGIVITREEPRRSPCVGVQNRWQKL
jgi:NAD(P)-dependent dehydrogenase (short-subunit alcohol dehydrogenase family)